VKLIRREFCRDEKTRTSEIVFGAFLLIALPMAAQECSSLNSSSPDRLASYLAGFPDKFQNAPCIAFAIDRLGQQQYEPAIPVLTKYLDFRWPIGAFVLNYQYGRDTIYLGPSAINVTRVQVTKY
jgi:hypothetical protein